MEETLMNRNTWGQYTWQELHSLMLFGAGTSRELNDNVGLS